MEAVAQAREVGLALVVTSITSAVAQADSVGRQQHFVVLDGKFACVSSLERFFTYILFTNY